MKYGKRCVMAVLALLVCLLFVPTVSAAPAVTVTVGSASVRPGDTVTLPVTFSAVEDLVAIELHLGFDSAVLEYVDSSVEGVAKQMNMSSATKAATAPDEVWLSGVALDGVSGEGVAFTVTFRVKENAPEGLSSLRFTDYTHSLLSGAAMTELPLTLQNGGVEVSREAAAPVTHATTVTTTAPLTEDTAVVRGEDGEPITRLDGQTVTLSPPNTVVDLKGAKVTDAHGETLKLPNVAVMVDQVTAEPTDEVTVAVSLSPMADMSILEISVTYDSSALTFLGGNGEGFMAGRLRIRETEPGTVLMQAEYSAGMSGDGKIATLRFAVKDTARAAVYRLGLNPAPCVMVGQALVGVQPFAGEIRVLSDGAAANVSSIPWLWIAVGVVTLSAVVTGGCLLRRRKGKKATVRMPNAPRTTDVSGDE